MKKWSEYTGSEKRMIIIIGVLLLSILLTFGRVNQGIQKGMNRFFSSPTDTITTQAPGK